MTLDEAPLGRVVQEGCSKLRTEWLEGARQTRIWGRECRGREQRVPREGACVLGGRSWSLGKTLDLAWGRWSEGEVPPASPVVTELEMLQKKKK